MPPSPKRSSAGGKFWYFNNGITVLCQKVAKTALGATSKKAGTFAFEGVSIVNGAQTVGGIGRAADDHPQEVGDARVTIRFISLENCPADFAEEVTRGTNTQNRVGPRPNSSRSTASHGIVWQPGWRWWTCP